MAEVVLIDLFGISGGGRGISGGGRLFVPTN